MDYPPGPKSGVYIPPSPGIYARACACGSLNDRGALLASHVVVLFMHTR